MDLIRRRYDGEIHEYPIYTYAEAIAKGIKPVPWRVCGAGDWGLTDDGWVGECLKAVKYINKKDSYRKRACFTFTFAKVWESKSAKLNYLDRKAHQNWSRVGNSTWQEREAGTDRAKRVVQLYVAQSLSGKVDWDALGQAYRPEQKIPRATVKRLFKQEKIQQMVNEALEKECASRGITKGFVLDIVKEAINAARNKDDAGNMLKGAEYLGKLLDINDSKTSGGPQLPPFDTTRLLAVEQEFLPRQIEEATFETVQGDEHE